MKLWFEFDDETFENRDEILFVGCGQESASQRIVDPGLHISCKVQ